MRWVALALLALPLAACGGVSINAVAKAATKASAAGSEHAVVVGTITVSGQTIKMTGAGDFQTNPKLGQMHLSMDVGSRQIAMDEVMQGWTIYMKSPIFASNLPAGKSWLSVDLLKTGKKLGIDFSRFTQQDPSGELAALKKAGSVTKVGTETIDGVQTTHYRATVDLSKIPNGAQLGKLAKLNTVPTDVWVDSSNLPRRLTTAYSVTTSGQEIGTRLQIDYSNYGEPVTVQVPSANETLDMTKLGG